jgi:predicted DNA-binding transcriptional regulator YafY
MQRPDRTQRILKMLARGTPIARVEFLHRLEISAATFKRDLDYLRDQLNVPVSWSREHRAYFIALSGDNDSHRESIPGTWFDKSELFALIAIVQILEQIEPRLLQDVLYPLRKRSASMLRGSGVEGERLQQALARIKVIPIQRRSVDDTLFEQVVLALVTRKEIAVTSTHRQTRERTQRTLSPQRIVCYRDNWYLDAWCHLRHALRTFSLDTLSGAHVADRVAIDIDAAALDQHFAGSYGIFAGAATQQATLRFSASIAGWIEHEQWHPEQTIAPLACGEIELTLPYANATELVRDILKWGPDVEVIAPATLREQVGAAARATADRYL